MIDCRKFDDLGNDKSLREHTGRNPKIVKSILESENDHALHGRPYDGKYRFSLSEKHRCHDMQKRTSSFLCERRVMVEHVGPLQSTSTLRFIVYLSEVDFWQNTVHENVRNAANSSSEFFRHTTTVSKLSVHDMLCDWSFEAIKTRAGRKF